MNKYIKITLSNRNEFRCRGYVEFGGNKLADLNFKIDTGCPYSTILLSRTPLDRDKILEYKAQAYSNPNIEKVISFGVNDTKETKERDRFIFKSGEYDLLNSVTCIQDVKNFTIEGCNIGDLKVKISYTRTGNILIGMDILSKLDIHIGKTSEGETIFLACPLDRINDEYLLEVERLFNTGSNIQSAQIRNRLDISN